LIKRSIAKNQNTTNLTEVLSSKPTFKELKWSKKTEKKPAPGDYNLNKTDEQIK
jgi:hypothetical protein